MFCPKNDDDDDDDWKCFLVVFWTVAKLWIYLIGFLALWGLFCVTVWDFLDSSPLSDSTLETLRLSVR